MKRVMWFAVMAAFLGCGYFQESRPLPTAVPVPTQTSTASAVPVLLTRQASDRTRLIAQHQELLQAVPGAAGAPSHTGDDGRIDSNEQGSSLARLDRELSRTPEPAAVPLAHWYRAGGGDLTPSGVWDTTPFVDVFPMDTRCRSYSALFNGYRRSDLYRMLYQLMGQVQPNFAVSWSEFQELAADNFAWELLPGDRLAIRIWTVIEVVDYDGIESKWVLGGSTSGEVRHYRGEDAAGDDPGGDQPVSGGFACPVFYRTQLDQGVLQEIPSLPWYAR